MVLIIFEIQINHHITHMCIVIDVKIEELHLPAICRQGQGVRGAP